MHLDLTVQWYCLLWVPEHPRATRNGTEKLTGGMEECTVESGWGNGTEMRMCDGQTDTLTLRKIFLYRWCPPNYDKTKTYAMSSQILRQQPALTLCHWPDLKTNTTCNFFDFVWWVLMSYMAYFLWNMSDNPYHSEFVSWHVYHFLFFSPIKWGGWVGSGP